MGYYSNFGKKGLRFLIEHRVQHVKTLAIIFVLGLVASAFGSHFTYNMTDSIDGVLFLRHPGKDVEKGSTVIFPLQHRALPPGVDHMVKIVMCIPGDILLREGRSFYCNGEFVATAKEFTNYGDPLIAFDWASGRIPEGVFFASTGHKDGFDSRYFGFVKYEGAVVLEKLL